MTGTALQVEALVQRGAFRLDATFRIEAGETLAVMGPSGAGKSTLLGVIAGLVPLTSGTIRVAERVVDAAPTPRTHVSAAQRGVVLLGQDPHLFPHLSAHDNITFGPRARGVERRAADADADEWLWRVGLAGLGARHPAQLSGGQQQRVAIARALVTKPAAVLLDEPLTSLDAETAGDIRALIREQLTSTGTTAIVATHDAVDAVSLASRLVVLEGGIITQWGPVRHVLAEPATRFAAAVAGLNRVDGHAADGEWVSGELRVEASVAGDAAAIFPPSAVHIDGVDASTWTGALRLDSAPTGRGVWLARVVRLEPTPAGIRVRTTDPDVAVDVTADRAAELGLTNGMPVRLRVDAAAVRIVRA
ncbi:ABC transporter ATP-binding protein [Microbacterium lacus]|uniref:sulfate/molybdate ABC transporter ATP-binding protein n=1 Tax=Microbacterium lacus TaxID=415217 RepID=UPI00384D03C1